MRSLLVVCALTTSAAGTFLGLPDPLGLFGPKCGPPPPACVCVCDKKEPHYRRAPDRYHPPPPAYHAPPVVAYQESPEPSYAPPPPAYAPPPPPPPPAYAPPPAPYAPPPPPPDYQAPPTYNSGAPPPAPNMPVYNENGDTLDNMGPPGSNYIPEFKKARKAKAKS